MKILHEFLEQGTLFTTDKEARKIKRKNFLPLKKYIDFQNTKYNRGIEPMKFADEDNVGKLKTIYVSEEDFEKISTELTWDDLKAHDDGIMEVEGISISDSYGFNDTADLTDSFGNTLK